MKTDKFTTELIILKNELSVICLNLFNMVLKASERIAVIESLLIVPKKLEKDLNKKFAVKIIFVRQEALMIPIEDFSLVYRRSEFLKFLLHEINLYLAAEAPVNSRLATIARFDALLPIF